MELQLLTKITRSVYNYSRVQLNYANSDKHVNLMKIVVIFYFENKNIRFYVCVFVFVFFSQKVNEIEFPL